MAKTNLKGLTPSIQLDRTVGRSIYLQLVEGLREAVENGALSPGTRLASTRVLASEWGVSRNTVVQAFNVLISSGIFVSNVGDGTYVAEQSSNGEGGNSDESREPRAYPFRSLSRRGRGLVVKRSLGIPERPFPFMPDVPDLREFPMRTWLRLMNEVTGGFVGEALSGASNAGFFPLRRAIAHHVSITRGLKCEPEQVVVTTGSTQGLDLVVRLLTDRDDPVWMEEPGYVGTSSTLIANGCRLQPLAVDDEGINIDLGIETLPTPKLIVLSPARQYPSGMVLSARRRRLLIDFARSSGAWVLEDDYDSEVHYLGPPPAAIGSEDRSGRVLFMGTFSKTLVPSLRLGYLILPTDLVEPFSTARSNLQGHASMLEQMVLAEMMNRGFFSSHVRRMRQVYRQRQTALAEALKETLDYTVPEDELKSGMHLVLPLQPSANDLGISRSLLEQKIVARPLSPYYVTKNAEKGLLLGFAAFSEEMIWSSCDRLAGLKGIVAHR